MVSLLEAEVKDADWKIFGTEDLTTPPGPKLAEIIDARISEMPPRVRDRLSLSDEVPDHRPGGPDRLPALPCRAP